VRAPAPPSAAAAGSTRGFVTLDDDVIVYHGTTLDCLEGIKQDGLRPGSFVAPDAALARDYAYDRAITLGADVCVLLELDVPDAAVVEVQSWWWARNQLMLPAGCPPSCILSVDDSDPRPFQAT
jgi:RNA:NAD 2'-phosphotransferase (TPT1/KptA family)